MTSLARQRDQATALVAGHGQIVAEFCDVGYSRTLAWARRPQAAALVAALGCLPDSGGGGAAGGQGAAVKTGRPGVRVQVVRVLGKSHQFSWANDRTR